MDLGHKILASQNGLAFKVTLAAVHAPTSNANLARIVDALSTTPRLYAHILIDQKSEDKKGIEESQINSILSSHFPDKSIKLGRDVFDRLDGAFVAKRWGSIIERDSHLEPRWVSTPLGDPLGDRFRTFLTST